MAARPALAGLWGESLISIIIPAHNEASVIDRCLEGLLAGSAAPAPAEAAELEVIVVANGCSDDTAARARHYGPAVRVVETPVASKSAALNLGDQAARGFPRFFVDADVELCLDSVRRVSDALRGGDAQVGAPAMRVDCSRSSWAVRAYYDIWTRLPYHRDGTIGSGVYAISEQGRSRFTSFPDIISDDGFVRLLFRPNERISVKAAQFTITAPRTLSGVIAVKTRSQKGWLQLRRLYPELLANDSRHYGNPLGEIARSPALWAPALVYFYVIVRTKLHAYLANRTGGDALRAWERDDSSRDPGEPGDLEGRAKP